MAGPELPPEEAIADALGLERDPRISEIFYFFSEFTDVVVGRTVGRKIGVVQEFMLKKYLEADPGLARRMYLERLLSGRSGAAHKVEFSWFWISPRTDLSPGDEVHDGLIVTAVNSATQKVSLNAGWQRPVQLELGAATPRKGPLFEFLRERDADLRITAVADGLAAIDVVDLTRLLASLESKRVGAQRFAGSDKLGSGIQTIEKAKQASLVAIDLDLQHNRNVKPLESEGSDKALLSFVALGNGVHWTPKDLQVLGTYVDYTFLVKDDGIIRYAEYVRKKVGEDDFLKGFMAYFVGMTKQPEDTFVISDDDFQVMLPAGEARTLRAILAEHVSRVNPV
ncbi:MAG TPA: hypothetical protein VGO29_01845 [Solirubrobacteraceae bacterium]|jgi:hypothetical protein|nr:hypothetical protein [Solirubrobacteraceae bacterium]